MRVKEATASLATILISGYRTKVSSNNAGTPNACCSTLSMDVIILCSSSRFAMCSFAFSRVFSSSFILPSLAARSAKAFPPNSIFFFSSSHWDRTAFNFFLDSFAIRCCAWKRCCMAVSASWRSRSIISRWSSNTFAYALDFSTLLRRFSNTSSSSSIILSICFFNTVCAVVNSLHRFWSSTLSSRSIWSSITSFPVNANAESRITSALFFFFFFPPFFLPFFFPPFFFPPFTFMVFFAITKCCGRCVRYFVGGKLDIRWVSHATLSCESSILLAPLLLSSVMMMIEEDRV